MNKIKNVFSSLLSLCMVLWLVMLMAVPAFAASTESKYDPDTGHPLDKTQELQALGGSDGSSQSSREDGVDQWTADGAAASMDDGTIRSMEETRQQLSEFRDSYYGDEGSSSQKEQQDKALGESTQYADVDASRIFGSDGSQSYGILNAGSEILNIIINAILLPAAILVVSWKTLYIGIFPILAGVDPLKQLDKVKGGSASRGRGGGDIRQKGQEVIKSEVKKLIFGLLIIFVVWIIIRIGVLIAVTVLSMF